LSGQSAITYSYDKLGRLVGVVDSINGSATYTYDAVGNLSAIGRSAAGQTSIIGFTPTSGPAGTQVTINGASFSSTPNQNTVSFNGVNATVVSATAVQLVVSVPAGASTGSITIAAPGGSATSGGACTVSSIVMSPVTLTVATPGQSVSQIFSGTAGQHLTVYVTNNAIGAAIVQVLDGGGNVITSAYNSGVNFALPSVTLATTGVYTISIQPQSSSTGSVTVSLTTP
jgi:YD repeat-containing protein